MRPYALQAGEGWVYRCEGVDFVVKAGELKPEGSRGAAMLEHTTSDRMRRVAACLIVVAALLSMGCSGKSGGDAAKVSGPHIPNSPLGAQIQYALDVANGKAKSDSYAAHFAPSFLASVPPDQLDKLTAQALVPAAPWELDHFIAGPTTTSASLIVKSEQGSSLKMNINIEDAPSHLIIGLVFLPYTP